MIDKKALRKDAEQRRKGLVPPDFAATLAGHAESLALVPTAVVSGYWPFRDEADPRGLMLALEARGHTLALPSIAGRGLPLRFHRWKEDDLLRAHAYGVMEPQLEAVVVTPSVLLIPLLAFDAAGYRLGYGGGYYDRTLERLRAVGAMTAVGIAYAGQEIASVPHDAYDQRLDAVLTENGLKRF